MLGERTLPRCAVPLITSLVPACRFPGCAAPHYLRCALCLLWGADLWLQPFWQMSTIQDPRKTWLATGSLLTIEDAVSGPEFAPAHSGMCFPGLHCSGSRLLCRGTVQSRPAFRALSRSKLLRLSFSCTPQGHRFSWACHLCPSQIRTAQVTRCLVSALSQVGRALGKRVRVPAALFPPPHSHPGEHRLRYAVCLL